MGDCVFLRVSPQRGHCRVGKHSKLSPRYVGPFEIEARVGPVAYRLALPPSLERVHNVFHVSQLRLYHPDPSHILEFGEVDISEDMAIVEIPVQILERGEKLLRGKRIPLVRVLWRHRGIEEETWE